MKKIFAFSFLWLLAIYLPVFSQDQKPVIGISSTWGNGVSTSVPSDYVEAVFAAGGVPLVIPVTHDKEILSRTLDCVDAVIMTGGEDIDPLKWYNEEPVPAQGQIAPERDEFDIMLIRMAVERGKPLLGICRGHQMLNVAFGGTLYQDIPSQVKSTGPVKHNQNAPRHYGTHTIIIEEGSLLYQQVGKKEIAVNSFHHQAVKDLAPGFKITARSKDGVVEAIEKTGSGKVFGVQFHPEAFTANGIHTFTGIFEYLVNIAKQGN